MTSEFRSNLGEDQSNALYGYYMDKLFKIEKAHLNDAFESIGITYSQFMVLNWIWRKGELTQKEIHSLIHIKPSSLTRLLDLMIKKGLVERHQDPNDARVKKIRTTQMAKDIESEAWAVIKGFDTKIREILGNEDYETTVRNLKKLHDALNVSSD